MFQQNQIHSPIVMSTSPEQFYRERETQYQGPWVDLQGRPTTPPEGFLRPSRLVLEEGPTGMLQRAPEAAQTQMQPYQQHILQGLVHNPEEERRIQLERRRVEMDRPQTEVERAFPAPNREAVRAATRPRERGRMKEERGNLWDYLDKADALCITTNGFFTNNRRAVMGRGCAKEAADRWPEITKTLGNHLCWDGNFTTILKEKTPEQAAIVAFPVKRQSVTFDGSNVVRHMAGKFRIGETAPGWAAKADLTLIARSAVMLQNLAAGRGWEKVVLVRPGCGAGELKWEEVKAALDPILDDRFIVITH
jgi:hypothetical protein